MDLAEETDFAVLMQAFKQAAMGLHKHHPRQNSYADKLAEEEMKNERLWAAIQRHNQKAREAALAS